MRHPALPVLRCSQASDELALLNVLEPVRLLEVHLTAFIFLRMVVARQINGIDDLAIPSLALAESPWR